MRTRMLSAPLRVADDLCYKDQSSLPASRPSGSVAAEHSASVHEREFEMSLVRTALNPQAREGPPSGLGLRL